MPATANAVELTIVAALAASPSYPDAVAVVSHPLTAILLILAVISVSNHMRLGMQIVIEDYVHDKGWKLIAVVANNFYAVVVAVACLFAILKISLGRLAVVRAALLVLEQCDLGRGFSFERRHLLLLGIAQG